MDELIQELAEALNRAARICDTAYGVLLSEGWAVDSIQGYLIARDDFNALAKKAGSSQQVGQAKEER